MQKKKALFFIQNAFIALSSGNRIEARYLAAKAIEVSPDLVEGWLLLAKLGSPRARIYYLEKALEIEPCNSVAREALYKAIRKYRGLFETKTTNQNEVPPSGKKQLSIKKDELNIHNKRRLNQVIVSTILVFMVLITSLLLWITFSNNRIVLAEAPAVLRPTGVILKPSLTPTPTLTPTMTLTSTPTPTSTNTPTPTSTYTETPTYTPTNTATNTMVPSNTPVDIPHIISAGVNWIDVDLSEQRLYAYTGDELVRSFIVSTGTWYTPTLTGKYKIYVKYFSTKMSGPGYYLPDVPYVMYYYKGYGIHGTYWHNNFGTPMSHGCINMATNDAEWVFNWSTIGTVVNIHN